MSKGKPLNAAFSRRSLLVAGVASAAALLPIHSASAALMPAGAQGLDSALLRRALASMDRHKLSLTATDRIAVIDFAQASHLPRLHLVDLEQTRVTSLLVAHGRGSDPAHTGWLQRFSNVHGSDATSSGGYATGAAYVGEHGHSLRLDGLDATNSNAEERAIVIHSAWYVNEGIARSTGVIGRSDGCFAVSQDTLGTVLSHLGSGRFVYADKLAA